MQPFNIHTIVNNDFESSFNRIVDLVDVNVKLASLYDSESCIVSFDMVDIVDAYQQETLFLTIIAEYENVGYDTRITTKSNIFQIHLDWSNYVSPEEEFASMIKASTIRSMRSYVEFDKICKTSVEKTWFAYVNSLINLFYF